MSYNKTNIGCCWCKDYVYSDGFCDTCEETTIDMDGQIYRDNEEFEQPDQLTIVDVYND